MKKFRLPPVGMRMIKTALAVMICLILGRLFHYDAPLYACIAAVLSVRETVDHSLQYSVTRMLSTLFGGAIGMLVLELQVMQLNPWLQILIIGLAVMFTIYVTVAFKRPDAAALAAVILLIIVLTHTDDRADYTFRRLIETLIGLLVAVGINLLIRPKSAEK